MIFEIVVSCIKQLYIVLQYRGLIGLKQEEYILGIVVIFRTPPALFVSLISVVAMMSAIMILLVLKEVSEKPQTVEAKLRLKPHETHTDFKILTVSSALLTLNLFMYGFAGLSSLENLLLIGEALFVVFSLPVALVFYKIWKRMN